ncbi:MAG: class I SAM-dependent methyltransferase [Solirubrobacterales bacterium]
MASGPQPFDADVAERGGYRYTTDAQLSSRLSNARITEAVLAIADFRGKRVIDIGCGDGAYTRKFADPGGAAEVVGVDPAEEAIEVARAAAGSERVSFQRGNAHQLDWEAGSFDVAHLRGVLHHADEPRKALREALRVAPVVVVVEPNGYNPGLKLLERFSSYHREHGERSFPPRRLDRWVGEIGGDVTARKWIGQVPFFCPDPFARLAKRVEPLTEALPLIRLVLCAQYLFVARSPSPRA